jgi:hypothetical protein
MVREVLVDANRPPVGGIGVVVGRARLSHEKLYDLLAGQFIKAPNIAALFDFDPYPDHVIRDERRCQSPVESGIRALI